jgi:hypothetical protein
MTADIIEAAARALRETEDLLDVRCGDDDDAQKIVHAILTAVTPLIRADALEKAARAFEPDDDGHDSHHCHFTAEEIAAVIRSLKERPPSPPRTP